MKRFFEVMAKCGHVGKGHYYEGVFYEIAEDATTAAKIVRGRGRVKHDHKDAIISVIEISQEEYEKGCMEKLENPYFDCKNKQEQELIFDVIADSIKDEPIPDDADDYFERRKSRALYKMRKHQQSIRSYERYYEA